MKRWLMLIAAVVLLSSCIGIESRIQLQSDGSGVLILSYKISQFLKNLDAGREEKRLPLPVSEEDFRRTAESIEGLKLTRLQQREDEQNVYIEATLEFDSVEAVNRLGQAGQIGVSLERSGESTVFRQVLTAPRGAEGGQESEPISEDSLAMVQTFFQDYQIVYAVTAPRPIQSHSLGELSDDRRTVTYRTTIPELLQETQPVVLELVW